jgi:histone H3/H4
MAQKRSTIIPKAPLGRIILKAGGKRVAAPALDAFVDIMQDIADDIAKQTVKIAKHSGRKTVKEGDVKIAAKH